MAHIQGTDITKLGRTDNRRTDIQKFYYQFVLTLVISVHCMWITRFIYFDLVCMHLSNHCYKWVAHIQYPDKVVSGCTDRIGTDDMIWFDDAI